VNIQPLNDRVLVKVEEYVDPNKESTFLHIPETAKSKPQTGRVLAVGQGRIFENGQTLPLRVKVGDLVLFGRYAGQDLELADGHMMLREDELLGVIENAAA
jgi:chaperonin GroES